MGHTYKHPFNAPLFGTTRVSRYQKGKINAHFTEARDSKWQCMRMGHNHKDQGQNSRVLRVGVRKDGNAVGLTLIVD